MLELPFDLAAFDGIAAALGLQQAPLPADAEVDGGGIATTSSSVFTSSNVAQAANNLNFRVNAGAALFAASFASSAGATRPQSPSSTASAKQRALHGFWRFLQANGLVEEDFTVDAGSLPRYFRVNPLFDARALSLIHI